MTQTHPANNTVLRYNLASKEGWRTMVSGSERTKPTLPDGTALADLSPVERERHNEARHIWHANMPPLRTTQMAGVLDHLWETLESNRHDSDKVQPAVAIDAPPGLGKTRTATTFGRLYHQKQMDMHGETTDSGNERVPVAFITLAGNTTVRMVASQLASFYGHPGADRGNANQISNAAAQCMLAADTCLVIIDEIHFLDLTRKDGRELANHLKWMANNFPVTFLYVGVGLEQRGLFREGRSASMEMSQIARRWTRLTMDPFHIEDDAGRQEWQSLLKGIERNLALHRINPGMLAYELGDYLYGRTTGHWGSLENLIRRGCYRAINTGAEHLTSDLLDRVMIDEAAESTRRQIEAAFAARRLTSRPMRPRIHA